VRAKSRPLVTRHAVYVLARDQAYGIDRAVRELGFSSRVSFAEGMTRTIAWLESEEGRAARR
jgi:nucleoside-diphosphate-sugar epimerase